MVEDYIMFSRMFAIATDAPVIGAAAALSSKPVTAGTYQYKRNITPTTSEWVRNAQACSTRAGRYFDEALASSAVR